MSSEKTGIESDGRKQKRKPKVRVLEWPAIPILTPEEVYGEEEREEEDET